MKRAMSIITILIAIFSLSACSNSCAEGHTWTYNVPEKKQVCSVCGEEETYLPSGYYISSEMLSISPWFNENQIACAYSESVFDDFNRNRSEEKANELIESGELFYVTPGVTCDFVDEREWMSPQNKIVITSGDMNGTECWTLTYAIASQEDLDEFYTAIRIDEESASQTTVKDIPFDFSDAEKIHSLVDQATQTINETGSPINSDGTFDAEKHTKLHEVLVQLFPYLGNDECDQLIMRDEMLTNLIIGMDNWGYFRTDTGESVVFIAKRSFLAEAGTMGLNVAVKTNDSFYSGTYYRMSNSGQITDTEGNVAGSIKFDSPDVITFTTKDGSVYTMNRIAKYYGLDPNEQISSAITESTEAESTESTTGDNGSQAESPFENTTDEYVGFFEGTYFVGTDIPAGTYRLVSLYPEYSAYWERASNASGESSAIIANDNFSGTTYVTVKNGEYFTVKRCSAALQ